MSRTGVYRTANCSTSALARSPRVCQTPRFMVPVRAAGELWGSGIGVGLGELGGCPPRAPVPRQHQPGPHAPGSRHPAVEQQRGWWCVPQALGCRTARVPLPGTGMELEQPSDGGRLRLLLHLDGGGCKIPETQSKAVFIPNEAAKKQPEKCMLMYLLPFLVF